MARTYRTLSLSLPPDVLRRLEARGRKQGKTAARVAVEMVRAGLGDEDGAAKDGEHERPCPALDSAVAAELDRRIPTRKP